MKEITYMSIKGWFSFSLQITLHFQAFDLQRTKGCQGDYVKVYDGSSKSSAVLMDKTCGSKLPNDVVASGSLMLVEFVTDGADTASGFQAVFTSGRFEKKENGKEKRSVSNQQVFYLSLHMTFGKTLFEELISARDISSYLVFDTMHQSYTGTIYSLRQMGPCSGQVNSVIQVICCLPRLSDICHSKHASLRV